MRRASGPGPRPEQREDRQTFREKVDHDLLEWDSEHKSVLFGDERESDPWGRRESSSLVSRIRVRMGKQEEEEP